MKKKIFVYSMSLFVVFLMWHSCVNAAEYTLIETMPGVGKAGESSNFPKYITGLYNFAIAFSVVSALLMVTLGGFYYIASAGNQAQAGTAKTLIKDALLGMAMVFLTWLVLHEINPDLINSTPDLGAIQSAANGSNNSSGNVQSTTVRGTDGKPYNSKKECEAAGNKSCTETQLAYKDAATYQKQSDGSYKELTSEEASLKCDNNNPCTTGARIKADTYGNVKSGTQIEQNIQAQSGATVSKEVDPKTISAPLEEKIIKDVKTGDPDKTKESEVVETSGQYAESAKIQATAGENAAEDNKMTREMFEEIVEKNGAIKQGDPKEETISGGFTQKTTTYVVPEGMPNAGDKYDVIVVKDGFSTVNVKIETYATKVTPPKDTELEEANRVIDYPGVF